MPLAKRKTKSTAKQEPKRSAVKKSKPSVMKKSKPVKTKSKSSISRKSKPLIIKKSKPVIPTMLNPAILKKTKPSAPTMSTPSPVEKTKVPAQGRLTLSAVTRSKTLAVQTTKPLTEKPKPVYIFSEMSTGEESELSIIERPKTSVSKKLSVSKKTTPAINKNLSARKKSRPLANADDVILTTKADFNFDIKNTGLFMQKWILLDKIPIIPHSSPIYRVVTKDGIYGDLRCFTKEEHPRLNMELMCLDKMEKQGNGHMFRKVCEMRMVNSEKDGFMTYVVTYHRPGIPLSNISSNTKILDAASGTRFGVEMIEIVENLAKAKILMKDISPDYFVIDQYSSKLFLSNASSLIGNAERFNINKNFAFPSWKGSFEHAPLRWHMEPGAPLTEGDVVESAFYVFLDMIGKLPWKSCEMIDIVDKKQKLNTSDMNLLRTSELPPSLITCMMIIRRGQMLDVCRTKDASSSTILLHKFREHGINGKPVPTAAMIEYGAIYTAMRTFGGIGNAFANLPLPASLTKPPPDPTRAALMDQLMRQKLERDALIIEIQVLHKMVNARHIHTKQLEAEVKNNERFIAKYVYQAENIRELKFEPHAAPMEETTNPMCPAAVMDEPPCFGHEYSLQEL